MKSRRPRGTSSLFRKATGSTTLRPPIRWSRGSANASWQPGTVFSGRGVNFLLLIAVVAAVIFVMFVGIPRLLDDKKEPDLPRVRTLAPPPEKD